MHRWESVKFVQLMCENGPFKYLHDAARLKFYINSTPKCSFVYYLSRNMYDILSNFVNVIQLKFRELVLDEYL